MTIERFIEYIQNCFNETYHPDMAATIAKYLDGVSPLYLAALANVCLRRHPRQYRTAPGIAEFERFSEEANALCRDAAQNLERKALPSETPLTPEERQEIADTLATFNRNFFNLETIIQAIKEPKL